MDSRSVSEARRCRRPVLVLALAVIALAGFASCSSPLEIATPRIDSVIVPGMRLRAVEVSAFIGSGAGDTAVVINWPHTTTLMDFVASSNTEPPIISFSIAMDNDTTLADTSSGFTLETLNINLEGVSAEGSTRIEAPMGPGRSGVFATALVNGDRYLTNYLSHNYQAQTNLTYRALPVKQIDGTVTITIPLRSGAHLTIIMEIHAEP